MTQKNFYADAEQGRNSLKVWVCGAAILYITSFFFFSFFGVLYNGLYQLFSPGPGTALLENLSTLLKWGFLGEHLGWVLLVGGVVWIAQKRLRQRPISKIINTSIRIRWRRIIFAIGVFTLTAAVMWVVFFWVKHLRTEPSLFEDIGMRPDKPAFKPSFKEMLNWRDLIMSALFIPAYYFVQEMYFRGFLDQGLRKFAGSKILAILISAFLFGLWQLDLTFFTTPSYEGSSKLNSGLTMVASYMLLGVFLSLITDRDQGIEAATGIGIASYFYTQFVSNSLFMAFWDYEIVDHEPTPVLMICNELIYIPAILILMFVRFGVGSQTAK